jgi:hypothetical protein
MHARFEFREFEGLGEVIVGAHVEPGDAIVQAGARREDQDRRAAAAAAQAAQHAEPVQGRQLEVQDDRIVLLRKQQAVGRSAVLHGIDREAALLQ